jgi:hypothetical protein
MTVIVNIHEAKTHLSRLLEQVAAGERIVIVRQVPGSASYPAARDLLATARGPQSSRCCNWVFGSSWMS